MADPVATVEKIVKIGLKIKDAVDKARHNEDECREIRKRVLRFSAILSQLQQTGMMNGSPAMSGALEDLEETLEQALKLVAACQERTTVRRLIAAGDLSKQLRRVKDDILNKVMMASFAINAHTTIVLLTIQAGGHAPPRQPQDTGVTELLSHSVQSTNDPRYGYGHYPLCHDINSIYLLQAVSVFSLSPMHCHRCTTIMYPREIGQPPMLHLALRKSYVCTIILHKLASL
ncbi:hypothetical protein PVAP13_8NG295468 [Panicum virgatum]|uniref:Mixed lineage kinase domain-containing protein n=1 Tax=Panicum virgatum TaxID=38727 RepID=A0A8T0PEX3_PANVG|nr:hypothetical protein PVAP13_8NG295468 [Panicum virgatum]